MLIDAHVHLQDSVLLDGLEEIMETCRGEGVGLMLCNGTRPEDWEDVAAIASRYREVIPCFGVHPWFVAEAGEMWESQLRDFLSRHASAVGECGIDRWVEPRDEALQERIFRRHLAIAREMDRPIMIHCLRAWGWLMEILESEDPVNSMLIHSYGGSAELIEPLVAYNAYFSFSGNIFEAKRQRLRDVAKLVPIQRLLVETDAPDMLPPKQWCRYEVVTKDGQVQNHPGNLPLVYAGLAELRGCDVRELQERVKENARRFLGDLYDARK